MPLSQDPELRARQIANLKQNNPALSRTHNAYSRDRIRKRSRELLAEYAASMPNATAAEVEIQCIRWAQVEYLRDWTFDHGPVRDKRTGTVYSAATLLLQTMVAWERQHAVLREREQAAGNGSAQSQLNQVLAELAAEDGR